MKNICRWKWTIFTQLILCFGLIAGCAKAPSATVKVQDGALFTPTGKQVFMNDIVREHRNSSFFLVGEAHTSKTPKIVASDLLKSLEQQGSYPLLGLEMLSVKQQPLLDELNTGAIPVTRFASHVDWKNSWGYDYSLYEPLMLTAHNTGTPIFGLNIPHAVLRSVTSKGMLRVPLRDKKWLPSQLIPPLEAQRAMLEVMYQEHEARRNEAMKLQQEKSQSATLLPETPASDTPQPKKLPSVKLQTQKKQPEKSLQRFLQVQSLWDSAMAENAAKVQQKQGRPMVLLAGSGHVEYGYGIGSRLDVFAPNKKYVTFLPVYDIIKLQQMKGQPSADYYYYCSELPALPMKAVTPLGLRFAVDSDTNTVRVEKVEVDGQAEKAGIQAGDTISAVNGNPVASLKTLHTVGMEARKNKQPVVFTVIRSQLTLDIPIPFNRE